MQISWLLATMPKTKKWPSEGMDGMAAGTHHGCSPPPSEMSQIPAVEAEHHPEQRLNFGSNALFLPTFPSGPGSAQTD